MLWTLAPVKPNGAPFPEPPPFCRASRIPTAGPHFIAFAVPLACVKLTPSNRTCQLRTRHAPCLTVRHCDDQYIFILLSFNDVRRSANADDALDVVTTRQFAVVYDPSTGQAYVVRLAIDPVAAVFLSDIMSLKTDKHVYTQSREFGTDCEHPVIGWLSATTPTRAPSSTKIGQDMPASRHAEGSAKVHTMCRNALNPGLVRYRRVLHPFLEVTPANSTRYPCFQTLTAYEHELVLR